MNDSDILNKLKQIYPVSRETFERLKVLVSRMEGWQKKTNLVAPSTLDDIWDRHICDSLQIIAIKPDIRHWVDIGSGGGFPGLVIAAVMVDHPESSVTLIESNQKKCAFLRQANRQMGANAKVICDRIEATEHLDLKPQVVTARALAELPLLLDLSSIWLLKGAVGLFHKGREFQKEISESNSTWSFDLIQHDSKISMDSVLLEISDLKKI